MKRALMTAMAATILGMATSAFAANPEPLGISLLRIEMKKSLMQQEVAPKMTQLRQRKLQEVQAAGKAEEAADAEVDLIQAQTAEAVANIHAKQLDLQLKESLKAMQQQPQPGPQNQPGSGPQDQMPPEPVATQAELSMLQFEVQKVKLQADAAARIAQNRQKLFADAQARADKDTTDLEADALAAQTSARMAALDVEASQMRLDAATKSTQRK